MRRWRAGASAIAGLTMREAMRQRLWLAVVGLACVMIAAGTRLQAADPSDRLKLAVVAATGAIGFLSNLFAILIGAQAVRRDVDTRVALSLFSKPLAPTAYLAGRWCAVVMLVALTIATLDAVALAATAWGCGGLPTMRSTLAPIAWRQFSAAGDVVTLTDDKRALALGGGSGNAVSMSFAGLPHRDCELLLRMAASDVDSGEPVAAAPARVLAGPDDAHLVPLSVEDDSPYGRVSGGAPGAVAIASHDSEQHDVSAAYLRLRVPASAIAADGSLVARVVRENAHAALIIERGDGALAAVPGGSFAVSLLRAGLVQLAIAGLLSAWTLFCALVAGLGTALLGGLTLLFAGAAVPAITEVLENQDSDGPLRRLLELAHWLIPDFGRYDLGSDLAATRAVEWSAVGGAWSAYGAYAVLFLALAWLALRRREW